jgi:ABC-type amino acid transport substrate-binding protein
MDNLLERFRNVKPATWKIAALVGAVLVQAMILVQANRLWKGHLEEEPFAPLAFVENDGPAHPPPAGAPAEVEPARLSLTRELHTSDLDGIVKRRHIRVLIVFNKTNYFLVDGVQKGFEYSLLRDYEKLLNKGKSGRDQKIHMEFIPVYRDQLIPKLLAGEGDIAAAGLTITPERLKQVDFTDPYLDGIDEVLVSRRGVETPEVIEGLSGREVHVRASSSYYESLSL